MVTINSWESSEAKQAVTKKLSESLEYKEQVTNQGVKRELKNKSSDFLKFNEQITIKLFEIIIHKVNHKQAGTIAKQAYKVLK